MTFKIQKLIFLFSLLLMATAAACGSATLTDPNATPDLPTGDEVPLEGSATLVCSQACLDRGQCGSLDGGQRVVLVNTAGPQVSAHDRIIFDNSGVDIIGSQDVMVQLKISPETQYATRFYNVVMNDDPSRTGWVGGWCVQQAAAQ